MTNYPQNYQSQNHVSCEKSSELNREIINTSAQTSAMEPEQQTKQLKKIPFKKIFFISSIVGFICFVFWGGLDSDYFKSDTGIFFGLFFGFWCFIILFLIYGKKYGVLHSCQYTGQEKSMFDKGLETRDTSHSNLYDPLNKNYWANTYSIWRSSLD